MRVPYLGHAGTGSMKQDELKDRVRAVMLDNVKEGYSSLLGAHYCYVMPSKERYQFQWFWDTCFHVFILCALGEVELAKRNMRSLFRQQEDNGFVGKATPRDCGCTGLAARGGSGEAYCPYPRGYGR